MTPLEGGHRRKDEAFRSAAALLSEARCAQIIESRGSLILTFDRAESAATIICSDRAEALLTVGTNARLIITIGENIDNIGI